MSQTAEEFREEQVAKAREQGATDANAVPEQRPIASQTVDVTESDITKRMREAGELNDEPMQKSAFDRASSDTQAKKAEKEASE